MKWVWFHLCMFIVYFFVCIYKGAGDLFVAELVGG